MHCRYQKCVVTIPRAYYCVLSFVVSSAFDSSSSHTGGTRLGILSRYMYIYDTSRSPMALLSIERLTRQWNHPLSSPPLPLYTRASRVISMLTVFHANCRGSNSSNHYLVLLCQTDERHASKLNSQTQVHEYGISELIHTYTYLC